MTTSRIWRLAAILPAFAVLAGCMSTEPEARRAEFLCEGGLTFAVEFRGDTAQLLLPDEPPIELRRGVTGSGFLYEAGTHSIRGDGRTLDYVIGRRAPVRCREIWR